MTSLPTSLGEGETSAATRRLVEFAATTRYEDLPAGVIRESKRCILDFLGVALGAADDEAPLIARETVRELGGSPQARILAYGDRTSVANAALVNGILSHVLDFDDTHIPTILHPTGPITAAGLPVGAWRQRSGRDLLAAHAVAFEVSARLSLAVYPEHYDQGWHMTGTTGTFGAAVSAARMLGLSAASMRDALGLAATQASGQREQFGAMAKSLHSGKAASNGVLAALLAMRGYTAAADSIEGRRGFFNVMDPGKPKLSELTDGLGDRWEIFRDGIKPYACGVVTHPGIDAVRALGQRHGVKPEDVERIELKVHPLVLELTGKKNPQTGLEGKFSITFACAIALIEGTARPRQFTDEKVRRADVIALRDRISATSDPGILHTEAVATAYLRDGRSITEHVTAATGTPENPIPDAELREKYQELAEPTIGRARADALAEMVDRLDNLEDLGALVDAATAD